MNDVLNASPTPANTAPATDGGRSHRVPLALKLVYTAFVALLVPKYWMAYGPTNFLYYCDVALLLTVPALWMESSLLASACAVGIVLPQLLWQIDFVAALFGGSVTGMTGYMFRPPFFLRFLSFFHFWLPILLLWLVWRLGYDRRGFLFWTGLALVLMPVCYFWMPAPPEPFDNLDLPVTINYVYGLSDFRPQEWMPPLQWFTFLLVGLPLLIYLPTHFLLRALFRRGEDKNFPNDRALFAFASLAIDIVFFAFLGRAHQVTGVIEIPAGEQAVALEKAIAHENAKPANMRKALVFVEIQDTTVQDGPAVTIARQELAMELKPTTIPFAVLYDPAKIDPRHHYTLTVRIEPEGRLLFINTTSIPVLTEGAPMHMVKAPVQAVPPKE